MSVTLEQFIQTVITGVSGYTPANVRPKWQQNPPKQPDVSTNWIAYSIELITPDVNAFANLDENGDSVFQRQSDFQIGCSFYGPNAMTAALAFIDGFQIQQNLEAMRSQGMAYRGFDGPMNGADLINGRWVPIWNVTLTLTRQQDRTYSILSFVSAVGSMHTVVNSEDVEQSWETADPPEE